MTAAIRPLESDALSWVRRRPTVAFMAAGFLALSVPTLIMIARQSWTDEQAQQGPFVLAIGVWLLWRRWPELIKIGRPAPLPAAAAALLICGVCYFVGRLAELEPLEAYALFGFLVSSLYALFGGVGVRRAGFSLIMIAFAAPIPFAVGWPVTTALRLAISEATVRVMHILGIPSARDGLTLFLASYRIEIAQACSGMNSLLTLTALGVCYVHLRRDPPARYLLALVPLIAIFAGIANFVRVLLLAGLTLGLGDAIAQGPLHQTLGLATFACALALTYTADEWLGHTSWAQTARAHR